MRCWRLGCWTTGPARWIRSCCPAWRVPAGMYVVICLMCDVKSTCMSSSLLCATWRVPVRHLSCVWREEYLYVVISVTCDVKSTCTSSSLLCLTWRVPASLSVVISLVCDVKSTFVYHLCRVWHEEYVRHLRYVWYKKYLCMSSLLYVIRRVSKSSLICVT